jgi:hypothetical protein
MNKLRRPSLLGCQALVLTDAYCKGRDDLSPENFYTLNALNAFRIKLL